jgi:hypothetical protein
LLQLVIDADKGQRRVIFFCACPIPCKCHRAIVAKMLCRAVQAQTRGPQGH